MPARERVPCHCLKCRGALVGKSTARQHAAQSRMGSNRTAVQSVPHWLAQNAASSSSATAADMDQPDDEEDEIRPHKRTRVLVDSDEDHHIPLVGYCLN